MVPVWKMAKQKYEMNNMSKSTVKHQAAVGTVYVKLLDPSVVQ